MLFKRKTHPSFFTYGTGNSFIRDFINEPSQYNAEQLIKAQEHTCDVIRLTHDEGETYSINLLGMGLAADIVALRNAYLKSLGACGYVIATLLKMAELRANQYCIQIDAEPKKIVSNSIFFVHNSRFTGGKMLITPLI